MYTIGVLSRSIVYHLPQYVLIHSDSKLGYYMSFLWIVRAANLLIILPREPTSVPLCHVSAWFIVS